MLKWNVDFFYKGLESSLVYLFNIICFCIYPIIAMQMLWFIHLLAQIYRSYIELPKYLLNNQQKIWSEMKKLKFAIVFRQSALTTYILLKRLRI